MNRELIELVGVSAGVWTTLSAGAWWLVKPRFQRAVFGALQDNPGEWRRWNDSQYEAEMTASRAAQALGERTHGAVEQIQRDLTAHRAELRDHRERMEESLRDLSHLPESMKAVARAIESQSQVTAEIARSLHVTQLEVATLKGRNGI